jgi:hypothetical protein
MFQGSKSSNKLLPADFWQRMPQQLILLPLYTGTHEDLQASLAHANMDSAASCSFLLETGSLPRCLLTNFVVSSFYSGAVSLLFQVGCALTFALEAKFEIKAKISFRLEAKKKPDFTWFTSMRNTKNLKRKRRLIKRKLSEKIEVKRKLSEKSEKSEKNEKKRKKVEKSKKNVEKSKKNEKKTKK